MITFKRTLLALSVMALTACGGGEDSGVTNGDNGVADNSVAMSGSVVKGPVANATVMVYRLNNDGSRGSRVGGPFSTDSDGNWVGDLPANVTGMLEIVANGGSYVDEASGQRVSLGTQELTNLTRHSGGPIRNLPLTPYSHAIAQATREFAASSDVASEFERVRTQVSSSLGFDPLSVRVLNPKDLPADATAAEKQYALMLGGISRLVEDNSSQLGGSDRFSASVAFAKDLLDGSMDGQDLSGDSVRVALGVDLPALDGSGLTPWLTAMANFSSAEGQAYAGVVAPEFDNSDSSGGGDTGGGDTGGGDTGGGDTGGGDTGGGTPIALAFDLSAYSFDPQMPASLSPTTPQVSAVGLDSSDFDTLRTAFFDALEAQFFGPLARLSGSNNLMSFPDGGISYVQGEYVLNEYDPALPEVSRVTRLRFGADGEPLTADDVPVSYNLNFRSGNFSISADHPGRDGQWFTADDQTEYDTVSFRSGFEVLDNGLVLIAPTYRFGPDGLFNTDDDGFNNLGYQIAILDPNGHRAQVVSFSGAGSDGQWITADDVVERYSLVNFDANGHALQVTNYDDDGADGTWFNEDDGVEMYFLTTLNAQMRPAYTFSFDEDGSDNTWFNSDDRLTAVSFFGYNSNGDLILTATHTSAGVDAEWLTADDQASAVVNPPNDEVYMNASLTSAGSDGVWLTADDELQYNSYSFQKYDSQGGRILFSTRFNGPGPDGQWLTRDDAAQPGGFTSYQREYNSAGLQTSQIYLSGPGADGLIFSADDAVSQYQLTEFDENNRELYRIYVNDLGADGIAYTADDINIYSASERTDENGTSRVVYYGNTPGPDGEFYTGDEAISSYSVFTQDAHHKTQESTRYNAPGPDAQWFTADDVISEYVLATTPDQNGDYSIVYYDSAGGDGNWSTVADNGVAQTELVGTDANGYPVRSEWLEANGDSRSLSIYSYDALGNQTEVFDSFSAGEDGIYLTADDNAASYSYVYDAEGNWTEYTYNEVGTDGIWLTNDDAPGSLYIKGGLSYLADDLADNIGALAAACPASSAASGNITVAVADRYGNALQGAIVQVGQNGATQTTNAQGEAVLSLNGSNDIHVFMDGYGWESFYCVEAATFTLNSTLNELDALSVVYFNRTISNLESSGNNVVMALFDSTTNELLGSAGGRYYNSADHVAMPVSFAAGQSATADLWAFEISEQRSEIGKIVDAVQVADDVSYTAENYQASSANYASPQDVSFALNSSKPDQTLLAILGTVVPPIGNAASSPALQYGPNLSVPFFYNSATYQREASMVAGVPAHLELTAIGAQSGFSEPTWEVYQPLSSPSLPLQKVSLRSDFLFTPTVSSLDTLGASNPQLEWLNATYTEAEKGTANHVRLTAYTSALIDYQDYWTLHLPAGESTLTLPTVPNGINSNHLLNQFRFVWFVKSEIVQGMDYQQRLAADVNQPVISVNNESVEATNAQYTFTP